MRSGRDGEAEEAAEGGLGRAAAVEPEGELVEVGLEVLLAQAVVDPQRPPLRVREHAVDPGQHQVRRGIADHPRVVLDVLEPLVAGPAVAHHRAALGHVAGDEAAQARGRVVLDHRQPGPPRTGAPDLDRPPGHRGPPWAALALQGQALAPGPPEAVVAAPRAGEAPAPAVLQQPLGAGRLVREPALELRQRPGKIRHGAIPPIPPQDWIAWRTQRDKPFNGMAYSFEPDAMRAS